MIKEELDYAVYTHFNHLRQPLAYGVKLSKYFWAENGTEVAKVVYQYGGSTVYNQCSFKTMDSRDQFLSWLIMSHG